MLSNTFLIFLGICLVCRDVLMTSYKIKIVSISDCVLPDNLYDKPNLVAHTVSAYKIDRQNTRIRANLSVPHKIGPVTLRLQLFEMQRNYHENYAIGNNQTCSEIYFATIIQFLRLNFTSECFILPGVYTIQHLNLDLLSSIMTYIWKNGRYGTYIDFRTPNGTITCLKMIIDCVKNKH